MTEQGTKGRRRTSILLAAAAALLCAGGLTAGAYAVWGNPPPPQPPKALVSSGAATATATPAPTSAPVPAPTTAPEGKPTPTTVGPILPDSQPTHLSIPSVGVDSTLTDLGQNKDGTVEVPPVNANEPAGWYTGSPTPGALGPAVILGHVDAWNGRSVFYSLGDVRPGDQVTVTLKDGTDAVFTVDRLAEYPKDDFPTLKVYGNTDRAELRLITCGGAYNHAIGHYVNNLVVYAHLTSSHPA